MIYKTSVARRQSQAAYRARNIDKRNLATRTWRANNPEKVKESAKLTYEKYGNSPTHKKHSLNYYYRNKEKAKLATKKAFYKRKYGITFEDYNELRRLQNFTCPICYRTEDQLGYELFVDHTTLNGKPLVRGLLCSTDNVAIGLMNHDIKRINRAKQYLK